MNDKKKKSNRKILVIWASKNKFLQLQNANYLHIESEGMCIRIQDAQNPLLYYWLNLIIYDL